MSIEWCLFYCTERRKLKSFPLDHIKRRHLLEYVLKYCPINNSLSKYLLCFLMITTMKWKKKLSTDWMTTVLLHEYSSYWKCFAFYHLMHAHVLHFNIFNYCEYYGHFVAIVQFWKELNSSLPPNEHFSCVQTLCWLKYVNCWPTIVHCSGNSETGLCAMTFQFLWLNSNCESDCFRKCCLCSNIGLQAQAFVFFLHFMQQFS